MHLNRSGDGHSMSFRHDSQYNISFYLEGDSIDDEMDVSSDMEH